MKSLVERFMSKVSVGKTGECWNWLSPSKRGEYGMIRFCKNGKWIMETAHRVSYLLFRGPIPSGKYVCHSCDNRACVNPGHLWIGTQKDNIRDMMNKGRYTYPSVKFPQDQVLQLRAIKGYMSCREAAEIFGISKGHVSRIWRGIQR